MPTGAELKIEPVSGDYVDISYADGIITITGKAKGSVKLNISIVIDGITLTSSSCQVSVSAKSNTSSSVTIDLLASERNTAKPGGVVNGRSPFILTVDRFAWFCHLSDKLEVIVHVSRHSPFARSAFI